MASKATKTIVALSCVAIVMLIALVVLAALALTGKLHRSGSGAGGDKKPNALKSNRSYKTSDGMCCCSCDNGGGGGGGGDDGSSTVTEFHPRGGGGGDIVKTCKTYTQLTGKRAPQYDLILTWYGVQTDGVVTSEMYKRSAQTMIQYMANSPLGYTGILLQLDPPTGGNSCQGKTSNYAADVDTLCEVVEMVAAAGAEKGKTYRVGIHAVVEADAVWNFTPGYVTEKGCTVNSNVMFGSVDFFALQQQPGAVPASLQLNVAATGTNPFYGGAGAAAPLSGVNSSTGAPYQDRGVAGMLECPYKVYPDGCPQDEPDCAQSWPSGCPGNMGRLAWYVCLLNWRLEQRNSTLRVDMMNWDAEGNGPVGVTCSIYQFMFGIDTFRTLATPLSASRPWIMFQNGSSKLNANAVTYQPDKSPCGFWASVPLPKSPSLLVGDVAKFQAAPEYYWFDGEDMGSVADASGMPTGMLPELKKLGLYGCPQSSPEKPRYDKFCGCRDTVYNRYARVPEGGKALFELLSETLYKGINGGVVSTKGLVSGTTPTFSIEHLGGDATPLQFDACINSANFCSQVGGGSDMANFTCRDDSKCIVRCGVANFFGMWSQSCFKQFLDFFAAAYGVTSIMIYDGGFVSPAWLEESGISAADAFNATRPQLDCPKWMPPDADKTECPAGAEDPSSSLPYCAKTCPGAKPLANLRKQKKKKK